MKQHPGFTFYEFFAGGGMARAGLGDAWQCVFANDFDARKADAYKQNWGGEHLAVKDVRQVETAELPGEADLAWASFPCQDLSLAGNGAGLQSERSGSFWPFWELMRGLKHEKRSPKIILLENVYGALTSRGGNDFADLCAAMVDIGYRVGAVVIDAAHFVPQSRSRLFVIAARADLSIPDALLDNGLDSMWCPDAIQKAARCFSDKVAKNWIGWKLPAPPPRAQDFIDIIEDDPVGVTWNSDSDTRKLLDMMSDIHLEKVKAAQATGARMVGGVYRRTRKGKQRAEVRFDNVAGCLRTPTGGSSRQLLLFVEGESIRSRLLSPREAARLMGLPDDYRLPRNYNAAYHLAGDGVVAPVVSFIADNLVTPLLLHNRGARLRVA